MSADPTEFLDAAVIARLSRLELNVRSPMLGAVAGMHVSATRGSSVEFAEYRKYVPGDDIRFVDWRVFARTDRFYMKEFEADTNLRCYVVLDTSASMAFSSSATTRFTFARKIAATIAHLLIHQGDAVGFCSFSNKVLREVPPRHSASHLRLIYELMGQAEPKGETELVKVLHDLAERIRQRSLVIIVSDLLTEVPELLNCFKHFQFYHHDVAVFHLMDRQEITFDFTRPVRFVDYETGMAVITDPSVVREGYQQAVQEHLQQLREGCRQFHVDYHLTHTDESYEGVLANFMLQRLKKKKRRG